jgi:hypothetical protein
VRKRLIEKFKRVLCAIFRHSNVVECGFGYIYCARCREQLGDKLGSAYHNPLAVDVCCDDQTCRDNWAKATWVDRFMARPPEWLSYPEVGSYNAEKKRQREEFMAYARARRYPERVRAGAAR